MEGVEESKKALVKRNPSDFLKQVIGKPIVVQLNSGVTYRGILACLDGFLNIAMEQTEEYVDGQLKARHGDCFLRGNNGDYVSRLKSLTCVTLILCLPVYSIVY